MKSPKIARTRLCQALVENELKAAGCDIVLDKQRLLNTPDKDTLEALRQAVHTIVE